VDLIAGVDDPVQGVAFDSGRVAAYQRPYSGRIKEADRIKVNDQFLGTIDHDRVNHQCGELIDRSAAHLANEIQSKDPAVDTAFGG
jgi:hypothetical protein